MRFYLGKKRWTCMIDYGNITGQNAWGAIYASSNMTIIKYKSNSGQISSSRSLVQILPVLCSKLLGLLTLSIMTPGVSIMSGLYLELLVTYHLWLKISCWQITRVLQPSHGRLEAAQFKLPCSSEHCNLTYISTSCARQGYDNAAQKGGVEVLPALV